MNERKRRKHVVTFGLQVEIFKRGFKSQAAFARFTGIDKKYISNACTGKPLGELLCRRIAQALTITWEELTGQDEEENE